MVCIKVGINQVNLGSHGSRLSEFAKQKKNTTPITDVNIGGAANQTTAEQQHSAILTPSSFCHVKASTAGNTLE